MKYNLDSDKAYGIRISMKISESEYKKFIEILFFSSRKDIFSYINQLYWNTHVNTKYKYHIYVKAETIDDENKVKERHFLWYEKTEEEFEKICFSDENIGYLDI